MMDTETLIRLAKVVAPVIMAGIVAVGGSWGNEELQATGLEATESKAVALAEEGQRYSTLNNWREEIEYRMVQDGKCDTALEGFARHRTDERDWEHVLEACHSEGEIDAGE